MGSGQQRRWKQLWLLVWPCDQWTPKRQILNLRKHNYNNYQRPNLYVSESERIIFLKPHPPTVSLSEGQAQPCTPVSMQSETWMSSMIPLSPTTSTLQPSPILSPILKVTPLPSFPQFTQPLSEQSSVNSIIDLCAFILILQSILQVA